MVDTTPFKTPLSYNYTPFRTNANENQNANSDESVSSNGNTDGGEISLVAEFDDLMRLVHHFKEAYVETNGEFLNFVEQIQPLVEQYQVAVSECQRLQKVFDEKTIECSDTEAKLKKARMLLDQEKKHSRQLAKEKEDLHKQMQLVRELLFTDGQASAEVKNKFSFLQDSNGHDMHYNNNGFLSAIKEINSTGSILSDFSYSKSEDDLDGSILQAGKHWKKHRASNEGIAEPAVKKRRSSGNKAVEISASDTVRATTTVTVNRDGPIMATSIIESIPKAPDNFCGSNNNKCSVASFPTTPSGEVLDSRSPRKPPRSNRQHIFQQKTVVMPDTCGPCEKRIRFGKTAMKCKDCKTICHPECVGKVPLPCVPATNTPNCRNGLGVIGDYTSTIPPMVPALLIHCINEIELRGLSEIGLYRIPGSERDVKTLKEKFLKGRGTPCLNNIDIHTICGAVKDFLRSLNEPIVPHNLWQKFVNAVEGKQPTGYNKALQEVIMELPRPNRDTLAYMILHLKKVADSADCKMNSSNLSKVFGPTIVGYSSNDPHPNDLLYETGQQNAVMEHLINLSSDYWATFLQVETHQTGQLQQTPSTDSLLRYHSTARGLFTPNRSTIKRKKYFLSPQV